LSITSVADLSGATNFSTSAAKAEAAIRSKTLKGDIFIGCGEAITLDEKDQLSQEEKALLSMTAWNVIRIMGSIFTEAEVERLLKCDALHPAVFNAAWS
jgi:hypothetical protein